MGTSFSFKHSGTSAEQFENEHTDYVMLTFASTLLRRPELADYHFPIAVGLLCNYNTSYPILPDPDTKNSDDLTNFFISTLFDGRVTEKDVKYFNKMMPTESQATDGGSVPQGGGK